MSRTAGSAEQAITQLVAQMDQAFANKDLNTLLAFFEETAIAVIEPGVVARSKSDLRSFFETVIREGGHATQLRTSVLETDGVALFLSHWTLSPQGPASTTPPPTFTATTVLRRQPAGDWKVLIDNPFGPLILRSR